MNQTCEKQISDFLIQHPDTERIEAIFATINGAYRGKWIPAKDFNKLTNGTLRLPISTYALDSWGIDVEESGLGIINGDPDGIGLAVANTISKISWSNSPAAQVLMTMQLRDEKATPCPYDPRQQLASMVKRLDAHNLSAVVALELEFYLIKEPSATDPQPQPFRDVTTGNLNNLDQMMEFETVLNDIRAACDEQNVLADVMIGEAGMCQFEINFKHVNDALRAADQAMLFKRIVKGCAIKHDMRATFMAKPFGNDLGSGLHMHVSLLDGDKRNIFARGDADTPNSNLLHATGGLLKTMLEFQAIFAPNLNSYRRTRPGSFAPHAVNWGHDHRGVSVRLPEISGEGARVEHRICGADTNPYLALTALLAGMVEGIENEIKPGAPINVSSASQSAHLHHDWSNCVDQFENSKLAKRTFGEDFHRVYVALRRSEIEQTGRMVSDVELKLYLQGA